ncbi:hypothetical protein BDN72DRAFT_293840 [Pluteus cervinus]|uniref:Uncharacterized protein n=1 Tax=Pluteus cervinus TaxID=181527 RepID=A0ACD3B4X0_9AGAR|nr:hypothetical protein BDN72DRAFT_293840 [Pluteus cervinus]
MLGEITVFNWITGTVCRTICGSYTCATLLDATYVICCHVGGSASTIDFRLDVYSILGTSTDQPIISFEYPLIHRTTPGPVSPPPCYFAISATLSSTSTRRKHLPFAANSEDSIIAFCIESLRARLGPQVEDYPWQMTSVVLVSSVLSRVRAVEASPNWDRKTTMRVPPGDWKHCTIPMGDDHVVYMHGSRMIVEREPLDVFTILDFDRKSVACKDLGTSGSLKASGVQDIPWVDGEQADEAMLRPRVHTLELNAGPGHSIADIEFDEDTITILLEGPKRMLRIHKQEGTNSLQ